MLTPQAGLGYVRAEPFRPFRIHVASGKAFEVRHPEMVKVLRNHLLVFRSTSGTLELPDEFETVSLMIAESIAHLEAKAAS